MRISPVAVNADIKTKIGNGEIGFVADTGNHRHAGLHDGTRHHFFIERPQVLDAATATAKQDCIAIAVGSQF